MLARSRKALPGLCLSLLFCLGAAKPALPEAEADSATTATNQSTLIDVLANDAMLGPDRRVLKAFKPGHGTATIENGRIRYTPAPGFAGADEFQYLAQAGESQPRVGTVHVEVGGGGVELRLVGRVIDDPIPGATVHVTVGGVTFVGVADENGFYSLELAALAGDAMVTLRATGTSLTGAPVEFVSMLGALAVLEAQAGGDGTLTLDDNSAVNITHLSTALYVLTVEANGGVAPASQIELQSAMQHVDILKLAELAAVIKLVVDGGEPMPAGVESVLDLISDPAVLAVFEDGLDPGQLEAAMAAISDDTAAASAFIPGRVPSGYALVPPSAPGTVRVGTNNQFQAFFAGASGGASTGVGVWETLRLANDPGMQWSIVGGDLVLMLDEPISFLTQRLIPDCALANKRMQLTGGFTQVRLHRIQAGAGGVDFLSVANTYTATAMQDLDPADACPLPASLPAPFEVASDFLGFRHGESERPYTAGEALGMQMLADYRSQPIGLLGGGGELNWRASLFDFASGTAPAGCGLANAGTAIRNRSFNGLDVPATSWSVDFDTHTGMCWQIQDGRVRMRAADPDTGLVREYTLRRFGSDGRKGEGVMVSVGECTLDAGGAVATCDGRRAGRHTMASRVDGSLVFDAASVLGAWRSGFDASNFQPEVGRQLGFFFEIFPKPYPDLEHTSRQSIVSLNSTGVSVTSSSPFVWNVEDGRLQMRGYSQSLIPSCYLPTNAGCVALRRREWQPIAVDGNRIYVLERLYQNVGSGSLVLAGERPNFYEVEPLPP